MGSTQINSSLAFAKKDATTLVNPWCDAPSNYSFPSDDDLLKAKIV